MQNTSQRRTHRPDTVEDHEYQQVEVIKNHEKLIKKDTKKYAVWSPINQHFYGLDDFDDDLDTTQYSTAEKKERRQDETFEYREDDLAWNDSPDQYEISERIYHTDSELENALRPKPLFNESSNSNDSSSHEEVFMLKSPVPSSNPELKRQNAFRVNKNLTEPRITRRSLIMSDNVGTKSQDHTPSRICLEACQDLSDVLRPHHPIVPEAVVLDQPQNLS